MDFKKDMQHLLATCRLRFEDMKMAFEKDDEGGFMAALNAVTGTREAKNMALKAANDSTYLDDGVASDPIFSGAPEDQDGVPFRKIVSWAAIGGLAGYALQTTSLKAIVAALVASKVVVGIAAVVVAVVLLVLLWDICGRALDRAFDGATT